MERSNEQELLLSGLQWEATGYYTCKVSTQTPIFTKTSSDEELTVIQPQEGAPLLRVPERQYTVGDLFEANCTSRPAHPVPHVTWLLNGDTVPDSFLRMFPEQPANDEHTRGILQSSTVQLSIPVDYTHLTADNFMHLSCIATIPHFLGLPAEPSRYGDYQREDASVEVKEPELPSGELRPTPSSALPVFLFIISRRCLQWR